MQNESSLFYKLCVKSLEARMRICMEGEGRGEEGAWVVEECSKREVQYRKEKRE